MSHNEPKNGTERMPCFRLKMAVAIIPVLLAIFWAGCAKPPASESADTSAAPQPPSLPTEAQPKLPTVKIFLGAETLDAEMAVTPVEEETGLMYRTNITDETAMLFNLHQPMQASFWMTNCPISLSAAYIGPDGVIEEIHHLEKDDNVPVFSTNSNILFVLEVSDGWFIRHNIGTGTLIRSERGTLAQTFAQ